MASQPRAEYVCGTGVSPIQGGRASWPPVSGGRHLARLPESQRERAFSDKRPVRSPAATTRTVQQRTASTEPGRYEGVGNGRLSGFRQISGVAASGGARNVLGPADCIAGNAWAFCDGFAKHAACKGRCNHWYRFRVVPAVAGDCARRTAGRHDGCHGLEHHSARS